MKMGHPQLDFFRALPRAYSMQEDCTSSLLLASHVWEDGDSQFYGAIMVSSCILYGWKLFFFRVGNCCLKYPGWWFGTFFIFPYVGNNHPN